MGLKHSDWWLPWVLSLKQRFPGNLALNLAEPNPLDYLAGMLNNGNPFLQIASFISTPFDVEYLS